MSTQPRARRRVDEAQGGQLPTPLGKCVIIEFLGMEPDVSSAELKHTIQNFHGAECHILESNVVAIPKAESGKLLLAQCVHVKSKWLMCRVVESPSSIKRPTPRYGHLGVVYTVWIGNIPKKTTRKELKALMQPFGALGSLYKLSQKRAAFDCAFVDFASPSHVLALGKAVSRQELKLQGMAVSAVMRLETS